MGIGNLSIPAPAGAVGELITPHGDRKRLSIDLGDVRGTDLITPHGDRKPERRWPHRPASAAHYPSWGSETTAPEARSAEAARTSLPLMGIGNSYRRCGRSRPTRTHYPSWGSETRQSVGSEERDRFRLITPHGDRKRGRACPWGSAPTSSLPLMGIGNRAYSPGYSSGYASHYPSWGSETRRSSVDTPRALVSLPLMGIGNVLDPELARRRLLGLITPHGDRKPPRSRPSTEGPYPHYPSWGSETLVRFRRLVSDDSLITPHGDRKLDRDLIEVGRLNASLPLMGIGNPLPATLTSEGWTSLPLMGIGNHKSQHGQAAPHRPHYPSWGSETLCF